MQEIAFSLPSPAGENRCGDCRSTLPRMPFAALSQRARARKEARLRRLRPAFFCPRQRQAAIPCGNAFQRRKRWIRHNDREDQRRGEVPSFVVSRMGSRGREIEIPSPGVLSLFVHFLFARAKRKWTPTGANRCVLPPSFARAKKKRPRDSLVKGKRGGSSRRAARRLFGRLYLSSPERSNSSVSPHLGQSIEPSSSVSSSKVISSPQTGHLTS